MAGDGGIPLSDLCEAIVDCEHKTAPIQECGIPSVRTTDIKNGRIAFESCNRVSEETYKLWTQRLEPRPGDLILAREAPVGEVGMIPPGVCACLGQRTVLIRTDMNRLDSRYLLYLLLTPEMRHEVRKRAEGSTVSHLNMSDIRRLRIPSLPALAEQQAIACILGTMDDKIELNRRMNRTLDAMARAIFQSWFVDFDPVRAKAAVRREHPGWTDEQVSRAACPNLKPGIAALFSDSFQDSELGEIPKVWKVCTLGDVAAHPRRGVQPDEVDASTPYIALEHMPRRCIALSEWGTAEGLGSNKFEFKRGEILFGKLRPYFHKVGIAPVDGICSTDIVVIAPKDGKWFGFALGHVSSDAFVEHTNAGSTGTKMPRTSWGEMARYAVVTPPETVAEAFTNQIRPAVDRIIASIHESRTLAALRDALLPKLLSGEMRVEGVRSLVEGASA